MDRMLYIAMAGARQIMQAQAVNASNLANASTTGFRANLAAFQDLPVYGPGYATRVYTQAAGDGANFSQGTITATGRALDVAINGPGWVAVQAPDGGEAYTRAGDLHISTAGLLVTASGDPVLGNSGPIAIPPHQKLAIGADGTISLLPPGQSPATLAVVDRIKLVNPPQDQLYRGRDGLFRLKNGGTAPPDAAVQLVSGALESSNVNAVDAMVNMMQLARQFDMQIKLMHTAQDNATAAARMMQIP